jgi:hypothetical protein
MGDNVVDDTHYAFHVAAHVVLVALHDVPRAVRHWLNQRALLCRHRVETPVVI